MEVLVAMSGGVDSSVAAALLLEQGHRVTGVTMRLWGGDSDQGCCSVSDVDDARRACDRLGIDHHVFNFADDFAARVVDHYVAEHREGRTPNPCIECNRHLKFDRLLERATALGFDAVATGHHARRVQAGPRGRWRVARGVDAAKDQSYVLYMLEQAALRRVLLPVGSLTKDQVRAEAARLGLRVADKPDSQDVCFITRAEGRSSFLGRRLTMTPGRVVDIEAGVVGTVPAVELVTIGQRRGLGVGGARSPRFAIDVDRARRTVTTGPRDALLCRAQAVSGWQWVDGPVRGEVLAQVSAHGAPRPGVVVGDTLRWRRPQPRVAAGQSIVLYAGELVLGGGVAVRATSDAG